MGWLDAFKKWAAAQGSDVLKEMSSGDQINDIIQNLLTGLGQSLQQIGSTEDLGVMPHKYTFLGEEQSNEIIGLLEKYCNSELPKMLKSAQYSVWVEGCVKDLNEVLKSYIQHLNKLKEIRSIIDLFKFKKNVVTILTRIKDICLKKQYEDYTLGAILIALEQMLDKKANCNEKILNEIKELNDKYTNSLITLTLGDFIKNSFMPLLNLSIQDLKNNIQNNCAIYINKNEQNSFELDFNKLGFKDKEFKFDNDTIDVETIDNHNGVVTNIFKFKNDGINIKKYKNDFEKNYKEAKKINQEINNNYLKIVRKINETGLLKDDQERYGFKNLISEYKQVQKDVNNKFKELKILKEKVLKEKNLIEVLESCEKIENDVKIIKGKHYSSLSIYNKIFDYVNDFIFYISKINNCKSNINVWKETINYSVLFNNDIKQSITEIYQEYFNNADKVNIGKDLVKYLKKAKLAYNLISELNKIVSNEKIFNDYYDEIDHLGFEKYGKLIKDEFNNSIKTILSKGIEKEFAINVDKELKKLKENVSLVRQYDKACKDLDLLCENYDKKEYEKKINETTKDYMKQVKEEMPQIKEDTKNMKEINSVQEAQDKLKSGIAEIEGKISYIKKNVYKTTGRIKIKANSFKDKVKGKLGIGSKSKNGKDEKKGNNTVDEK